MRERLERTYNEEEEESMDVGPGESAREWSGSLCEKKFGFL